VLDDAGVDQRRVYWRRLLGHLSLQPGALGGDCLHRFDESVGRHAINDRLDHPRVLVLERAQTPFDLGTSTDPFAAAFN
jgi:hypothetical protein